MRRTLLALALLLPLAAVPALVPAEAEAQVPNLIVLDAQSAAREGRYQDAIDLYTQAIATGELKPFMLVAAYNGRGLVYYRLREYPMAIEDYSRALAIEPNDDTVLRNRCFAFIELREWGYALDDCQASAAAAPDDPQGPDTIGYLYYRQGLYGQALEYFNRSLAMNANFGPAYLHRGMTYDKLGNREAARADLLRAKELLPNNPEVETQMRRMGMIP